MKEPNSTGETLPIFPLTSNPAPAEETMTLAPLPYGDAEEEFEEDLAEEPECGYRKDTIQNMQKKACFHDYSEPGCYMLSLSVNEREPLFGELAQELPARMEYSELGKKVIEEEIKSITANYPNVSILNFTLLPDRLHLVVKVETPFEEGRHLGHLIRGFKTACTRVWWDLTGVEPDAKMTMPLLFENGYNDRILPEDEGLKQWLNYLADSPRRLFMMKKYPNLFKTRHSINVQGLPCEMVGNGYLLNYPDKMAVIVHRHDGEVCYARNVQEWMECGERGGVLVGAFVSPREKAVKAEAEKRGYRIIEIIENGFPQYYRPTGMAFDACEEGILLQVSPWPYHYERRLVNRQKCLAMNRLAVKIAEG